MQDEFPTCLNFGELHRRALKSDTLPGANGCCFFFGEPFLWINDPAYLTDIYVNKNMSITKSPGAYFAGLQDRSIFFDHTKDPVYIKKRKDLSGAFFKSKLLGMIENIKEISL
jgi:hypothetical protein